MPEIAVQFEFTSFKVSVHQKRTVKEQRTHRWLIDQAKPTECWMKHKNDFFREEMMEKNETRQKNSWEKF